MYGMKRRQRRGYTFVEILVVITIIGILVALLLPAVQAAREAGRRNSCAKSLEQLMIGIHSYEMLHGVYPPGTIDQAGPVHAKPQGYHHNWIVQLLPFVEEKNLYAHIDRRAGVYHPNNAAARRTHLPLLNCPSSTTVGRGYSDYAAVHNGTEAPIDRDNDGTFFLNSHIGYVDIKDGGSNTIFLGEKFTIAGDLGWMSGTRATLRNTGVKINAITDGTLWRRLPDASGYPPGVVVAGAATTTPLSDEEFMEFVYGPSGSPYGRPGWEDYAKEAGITFQLPPASLAVGGFGGRHPGGAMFALGDSSVRFISETILPGVYLHLGSRADQTLQPDQW